MPNQCPHCRFPFDPDWGDDGLPALCPRCGERIGAIGANNPRAGIATFLRTPAAESPVSSAADSPDEATAQTPDATATAATTPTVETTTPPAEPEATSAAISASPSFVRRSVAPEPSARVAFWQWVVLLALLFALPLQWLLADRARLAADAQWRPLMVSLCTVLRCELPPWREPQAFTMLGRDVRPAADAPGMLQVRAEFRNDARWAQPLPRLQLSLADADGRTIGLRAFEPREYLGKASVATLAPGQAMQVAFRIREPATPASAFQFEFR